jgi:hypothetical protein
MSCSLVTFSDVSEEAVCGGSTKELHYILNYNAFSLPVVIDKPEDRGFDSR